MGVPPRDKGPGQVVAVLSLAKLFAATKIIGDLRFLELTNPSDATRSGSRCGFRTRALMSRLTSPATYANTEVEYASHRETKPPARLRGVSVF